MILRTIQLEELAPGDALAGVSGPLGDRQLVLFVGAPAVVEKITPARRGGEVCGIRVYFHGRTPEGRRRLAPVDLFLGARPVVAVPDLCSHWRTCYHRTCVEARGRVARANWPVDHEEGEG